MRNRNNSMFFLSILLFSIVISSTSIEGEKETVEDDCSDHIRFYAFTLFSPLNRTYQSRILPLNVTFSAGLGIRYTLSYILDERLEGAIPFEIENPTELHVIYRAQGYLMLPELSEGTHNLTIILLASGYQFGNPYFTGSVQFKIDTLGQPNIPEFGSSTILLLMLSGTTIVLLLGKKLNTQKGNDNKE